MWWVQGLVHIGGRGSGMVGSRSGTHWGGGSCGGVKGWYTLRGKRSGVMGSRGWYTLGVGGLAWWGEGGGTHWGWEVWCCWVKGVVHIGGRGSGKNRVKGWYTLG